MTALLVPIAPDDFLAWLASTTADYVDDLRNAGPTSAAAEAKARAETEGSFPGGVLADDQLVFSIVADGERVGTIWIAPAPSGDPTSWWVYDITIESAHRGRGFGRQAMLLAEREAVARGATTLGLNVFAANSIAHSLYESLGYRTTASQMQKPLAGEPPPRAEDLAEIDRSGRD